RYAKPTSLPPLVVSSSTASTPSRACNCTPLNPCHPTATSLLPAWFYHLLVIASSSSSIIVHRIPPASARFSMQSKPPSQIIHLLPSYVLATSMHITLIGVVIPILM